MDDGIINIYCDESCHLPNDVSDVMVLGALSCPNYIKSEVNQDIRRIKCQYDLDSRIEIKWTKVSGAKIGMFEDLIDYFFSNPNLTFRGIIAKNKSKLDHKKYNDDDWDLWYYKMYYLLLDKLCYPQNQYRIFIDIKDTNGGPRLRKLRQVLCNNIYDFKGETILDIQQINSSRTDLLQLTDILTGALSFYHRGFFTSPEHSFLKKKIVSKLISHIDSDIETGTPLSERKCNLFVWLPKDGVK